MKFCSAHLTILLIAISTNLLSSADAYAGGTWDPVLIERISVLSDTDYVLVVLPTPTGFPFPVFGSCRRFEVHGSFSPLDGVPWFLSWFYEGGPSREDHLAALRYLRKLAGSGKEINFGAMGYGFNPVNPKNPCVVESRGLQWLHGAVVSYYHEI
jgi:hypothetical protein